MPSNRHLNGADAAKLNDALRERLLEIPDEIKDQLCAARGNPALLRKIIRLAIDAAYLDVLGPAILSRLDDAKARPNKPPAVH
jgi:hypothetical protein